MSVWDHRPTAAELLEQRLASGWRPKPSLLKEGDVVEGYAACLIATRKPGSPDR